EFRRVLFRSHGGSPAGRLWAIIGARQPPAPAGRPEATAMKDAHDQSGPVTPFERNFYIFVLTVFLGLLAAEIIKDYQPVKLAVLFIILFWPPLVVLHEAGHALMADLLGWEVRRIVIGLNREVWRFRVR